jgi:tetratricopeptide (TPR) repeat protein
MSVRSEAARRLGAGALAFALCMGAAVEEGRLVALSGVCAQVSAQRVDAAKQQVDDLEARFLKPELVETNFAAESRLNDGKVAYGAAQYGQASVLFLDVVLRTTPQSFPSHRDALYLLGDSLLKTRNFRGARGYLSRVVDLGPGTYYQESLERLLQIAYETGTYDGIEQVYAKLDTGAGMAPALAYLRGKTLFEQGRFEDARPFFSQAEVSADFKLIATYFDGVTLVSLKRLDEARLRFEQVVAAKPANPREERLYYLSYLSLGRLAYEQGKYEESLDLYNRLPRTDPNFARSIYEATWTLVQMEKYKAAQENIDVLRYLGDPDPKLYTDAMLLRADLSVRIKDYATALESFEDVLSRYDGVYQQMSTFAATQADLPTFFQSLIGDDLRISAPQGLPSLRTDFSEKPAEEWLGEGRLMAKTRLMMSDLASTRRDIQETNQAIERIQAKIDSGATLKSFPKIAEGLQTALTVEGDLLKMRRELVEREAAIRQPAMSGPALEQWSAMSAQLKAMQAEYEKIPSTANALATRETAVEKQFAELRRELDELGYNVSSLQANLVAAESFVATGQSMMSDEQRAYYDRELPALRQELADAELLRQQLRQRMEVERQRIGLGDAVTTRERQLRQAYRRKLAEAGDLLARQGAGTGELERIAATRRDLTLLEARLDGFHTRMTKLVNDRLVQIRRDLDSERALVNQHARELEQVVSEAKQLAGEIAYKNFIQKLGEFEAIILRADVGKIDVMFQQKEDASQQINELFMQRTEELRKLQESFEEVR